MDNISNQMPDKVPDIKPTWFDHLVSPAVRLFNAIFGSREPPKAQEGVYPLQAAEPHLKDEWKRTDGTTYATEECHTPNQKEQNLAILKARLEKLKEGPEKERVERRIAYLNKHVDKEYVGSSDFRSFQAEHSFEEAESFHSGLVNAHLHTQIDDKNFTLSRFARFGVMSDMAGGFYSIEFLEELQNTPKEEREQKIEERINQIDKIMKKQKGEKAIAACAHAKARLHNIRTSQGELILKDMIEARRGRLEEQALGSLMLQLEGGAPKADEPLLLLDVRLLDQTKHSLDKSGWMHGEAEEFEDHRAALKMLDEKTLEVVALGSGPLLQGDKILIPESMAGGLKVGEKVPLKTFCFQCSPQGNVKNSGAMREHNMQELERLKMSDEGLAKEVEKMCLAPHHGYTVSTNLLVDLSRKIRQNSNRRLALGCLSAKDRSGATIAAANKILRQEGRPKMDPSEDVLRPGGIAARIARLNSGTHLLKIAPKSLLLEDIPGIGRQRQLTYLLEHALEIIRGTKIAA